MKTYTVKFGDSDKYSMHYDGDKTKFENSDEFRRLKEIVYDYVKEKFPGVRYKFLLEPEVEEYDDKDKEYPGLDSTNLAKLKADVLRQVEIRENDNSLNNNAPYSDVNQ